MSLIFEIEFLIRKSILKNERHAKYESEKKKALNRRDFKRRERSNIKKN